MVKTVECIGYFINVCTDLMRCFFFESILNGTSEFCQLQHKVLLACIDSRKDFSCFKISAFFFITIENGFDTNDRIQDIRTCISFEGSKTINIKHIIFGCLIGQVTIFDCRKSYNLRCFFCILIFDTSVLDNLMEHLFVNICDEIFQTHNTALSCFERFSVFSIHGTKSKERKFRLRFYKSGLSCTAEYLNEMKFLTFVYYIKNFIRIKEFDTLYDRCKICCGIQRSSV